MPGDTPVTRTKSPCFALRRIGSFALGRAYIDTLGTVTSGNPGRHVLSDVTGPDKPVWYLRPGLAVGACELVDDHHHLPVQQWPDGGRATVSLAVQRCLVDHDARLPWRIEAAGQRCRGKQPQPCVRQPAKHWHKYPACSSQ